MWTGELLLVVGGFIAFAFTFMIRKEDDKLNEEPSYEIADD